MPRQRTVVLRQESYQIAVKNFYQTLVNLGYNQASSQNGQHIVEDFLSSIEQQNIVKLNDIQTEHIEQYYKYLQQRPNKTKGGTLHPKTIHSHIRYLNHFFDQQQQYGEIIQNPFDSFIYNYPKIKDKERLVLTLNEIKQLYRKTENLLEKAVLSLAYGCGLRAGEIERLNLEDVDFRSRILIVKRGKGNKRRVVPLAGKVLEDLENYYFNERIYIESLEKEAFLLNKRHARFREYCGNYILKSLIKRTKNKNLIQKIDDISLHNLRHSIATHLLEQGMPLEKVRDFLGHYHLETTEIYTHINQNQINQLIINNEL